MTGAAGGPGGSAPRRVIGVAFAIPEPMGTELQRWRENFGDPSARAIPAHITLLPPTEVPETALPGIEGHLAAVADEQEDFGILLRGTGSFRPMSPVVFVTVAEGISSCERVEQQVRVGPLARELDFPYHPHVTVAHDLSEGRLDHASDKLAGYEARFTMAGFALYEHGSDGIWRPRREFAFGASSGTRNR